MHEVGSPPRLRNLFDSLGVPACGDCSACCAMPFLLREELPGFQDVEIIDDVPFLAGRERCGHLVGRGCGIYPRRPLDCRLFPLGLAVESDRLWWVVFDLCPQASEVAERVRLRLADIERCLQPFHAQYERMAAVTRSAYPPCAEGRYLRLAPWGSRCR